MVNINVYLQNNHLTSIFIYFLRSNQKLNMIQNEVLWNFFCFLIIEESVCAGTEALFVTESFNCWKTCLRFKNSTTHSTIHYWAQKALLWVLQRQAYWHCRVFSWRLKKKNHVSLCCLNLICVPGYHSVPSVDKNRQRKERRNLPHLERCYTQIILTPYSKSRGCGLKCLPQTTAGLMLHKPDTFPTDESINWHFPQV